jgi:arginine decarboxylase
MIICNGFKDEEYVETALLARRLGQDVIIVLDRPDELILVLDVSKRLGISPKIGVRCKLASRGSGRWEKSGGDRAKFGLTASELVNVVDELAARKMLDALVLLHFHVGSQITDIGAVKRALREAARVYSELRRMGAGVRIMDVGGGLGVDYTGAKGTHSEGSRNYTNEEYARDVIYWIGETCDLHGVPHPDIVSESGRALVAHHSVLVFDVLSATERRGGFDPTELEGMEVPVVVQQLLSVYEEIGGSSPFEAYHDALHLRQEFLNLFQYGLLDLRWRGVAERIFTSLCVDLLVKMRKQDDPPEELARLEAEFADIYYANFSLFHSLPDAWAIEQVFPVMPLQRLLERPTHRAVIADLTCDSDGMLERFSGPEEAATLAVHELDGERYLMGAFLVGAYQEILGDYHNLFGDTNAVLVKMAPDGGYDLLEVSEGETVERVLGFVQYSGDDLLRRMRKRIESAVRDGNLSLRQSRGFLKTYGEGLRGYTYLEGEHEPYVERVGDDE